MGMNRIEPIERSMHPALKVGIALVLSLLVLGLIVYWVGFRETVDALGEVGVFAFLMLGVLAFLPLGLQALAWAPLNQTVHHRIPFWTLFEATTMGMAVNILTPSSYLGGEPVKIFYVGKKERLPYGEVAGTVVLAKWLEALSFLSILSATASVAIYTYGSDLFSGKFLALGIALLSLIAVLVGSCCVLAAALWRGWRPLTVIMGWVSKLRPSSRKLRNLRVRLGQVESQVTKVFKQNPRLSTLAFFIFMGAHITLFLRPWVFFILGAGIGLDFGQLCLIFVSSQALSALQFTPSGIGTLDGGLIGVFILLGLGEAPCLAYLLCARFWDAVIVGAGALLGAKVGTKLLTAGPPPSEADGASDAPAAAEAIASPKTREKV